MTLPSLVLGILLISLLLEYVRPLSDHSSALAHPSLDRSRSPCRRLLERWLPVGGRRVSGKADAGRKSPRIGSSRWLDHHEGGPVPDIPILEGTQVLSSWSEYLASP